MRRTRLSHRELLRFSKEAGAGEANSIGFECLEVVPGSGVPGGRTEQGGEQKEQRMAGEIDLTTEVRRIWRVRGNEMSEYVGRQDETKCWGQLEERWKGG